MHLRIFCLLTAGTGTIPWCWYSRVQLSWMARFRCRSYLRWVCKNMYSW